MRNIQEKWGLNYNFNISQNYVNSAIEQCSEHVTKYKDLLKNKVILDIGSNFGYFSRIVADEINYKELHLFEPCKQYFEESVKLLNGFENLFFHNVAVGSDENTLTLYKERIESNPGWNTLLKKDPMQLDGFYEKLTPEEVSVKKLDDYYKDIKQIDFIKIDVEGWERHVLNGAFELISKFKPYLLIEVAWGYNHPEWMLCKETYDRLFQLGYKKVDFTHNTQDILFEPIF